LPRKGYCIYAFCWHSELFIAQRRGQRHHYQLDSFCECFYCRVLQYPQYNSQQLERRDTWELLADSDEEGDKSDDGYLESGGNCDKLSSAEVEGGESDESQDEEFTSTTEIPQTNGIVAMDETADEESERELDDDQMMAMDDELALMFKDRVKSRKDKGVLSCLAQAASVDGCPRRSTERSDAFQKPDYGSFGHLR
jgi:hypothetical protein